MRCSCGQSDSFTAGARAAIALNANQIIVCLADMPFVSVQLINDLLTHAHTHATCASKQGGKVSLPAALPKDRFNDLLAPDGDRGAFSLLSGQADCVFLNFDHANLNDLDTIADFQTHAKGGSH